MIKNSLTTKPFNNVLWRDIISQAVTNTEKHLNINIESISPFGFELLENTNLLNNNLKKYYIYAGIKDPNNEISLFDVASCISEEALLIIKEQDEVFYSDISILVLQDEFNLLIPKCDENSKLLDVQVRRVSNSIISDYADYIICCTSALYYEQDEPKMYHTNVRHRIRTIQLYIMIESLFGYLIVNMNLEQSQCYSVLHKKIKNSLAIFFDSKLLLIDSSIEDKKIMDILIKPRIKLIMEQLSSGGNIKEVKTLSYHVSGDLEIMIDSNIYDMALLKIKNTYQTFI
jgi:hypothetical protein